MSSSWTSAVVGDCLTQLSLTGKTKIQTRDYRPSGRFPIIDQGQAKIAGWTDDEKSVIDSDLPLIVFGDHTRALKYVDFPFARGADGTQLLKPKDGIDPLFFYYACRAIDLPGRGYNRHFSILKEKSVSYPVREEQSQIGSILRTIEKAIDLESDLVTLSSSTKRVAMRELFARGLRGEAQKETEIGLVPESWNVVRLELAVHRPDYGFTASANADRVGPKFLRITDIQDGTVDWDSVPYCSIDEATLEQKRLADGDIVVARIGATTGKAFLIRKAPEAVFASYMIRLRVLQEKLLSDFLYYFMQTDAYWTHVEQNKGGRLKGGVNIPVLLAMPIPLPRGLGEQREIVGILNALDRKITLHRRKRTVLDALFKSLLHKLMIGEIRAADLDLSVIGQEKESVAV